MRLINISDTSQVFLVGKERYVLDPDGLRANRRVGVIQADTKEKLFLPASIEVMLEGKVEEPAPEVTPEPAPEVTEDVKTEYTDDVNNPDYIHPDFREG